MEISLKEKVDWMDKIQFYLCKTINEFYLIKFY